MSAAAWVLRQYTLLVNIQIRSMRAAFWFIMVIQISFAAGLVLGLGYLIPDISKETATYLTVGAATQQFVTVGLVMLPQFITEAKTLGRLEYFLTMPISREAYLMAQLSVVAMLALPGVILTLALGSVRYGIGLSVDPIVVLVALLAMLSLAGVGVALGMACPLPEVTNSITNLIIFYVLFFAPVLVPSSQLPWVLQKTALVMPPTYAADAMRATLTHLPDTHLGSSLLVMAGFAIASSALSAVMIRRQG